MNLASEPVAIIGTIQAILIAIQQLALPVSSEVHAAIAAAIVTLGIVLARSQVTPTAATKPTGPPTTGP